MLGQANSSIMLFGKACPIASVLNTWEPWASLMLTGKHGRLNSLQGSQECGSPSTQFVMAWRSRSHGKFHILQGFSRQSSGKSSHDSQNEGGGLTLEYYQTFGLDLSERPCDSLIFVWTPKASSSSWLSSSLSVI